ncbi:hypothetical protein QQZ08_002582 [Neonectria magnoliae]|uniref:Uncharacterized protein n=1 Tax=Neonectria magnoliae TaxID=2732573 RepID=A0ABR1IB08_9HYPO
MGASDAYADVVTNTFCAYKWMSRYQGRARKIGERPVASAHDLFCRIVNQEQSESGEWLEPQWEDDDSDYEQETSKPFSRPKKTLGRRVKSVRLLEELKRCPSIPSEEALRRMDDNKMSGGPPQIHFIMPEAVRNRLHDHGENMPSTDVTAPTAPTASKLERPRKPIRARHGTKVTQLSLDEILRNETITDRTAPAGWDWRPEPPKGNDLTDMINDKRPARTGTWSGVAEVLACDIGTHQVAYLMGGSRNYTDNWEGQERHHLSVLPTMSIMIGNPYMTIESRAAGGSLDGEWIETWARIQCRLMAFARDAEPAEFMRVIGLLGDDDGRTEAQYDVVDLLEDIGCYAEARVCEERVARGEEAYSDNMLLNKACVWPEEEEDEEEDEEDEVNPEAES